MVFGKVLQILVVSSNNTERQLLVETFQYGFIAILHHYLHAGEM